LTQWIVNESAKTFGHWLNAVDRQRGVTETFGYWLDTADCPRAGTETLGHWFDAIDRLRRVLKRLVSG